MEREESGGRDLKSRIKINEDGALKNTKSTKVNIHACASPYTHTCKYTCTFHSEISKLGVWITCYAHVHVHFVHV